MPQPKRQSGRSRSTGTRKSTASASTQKRAAAARTTAQRRKAATPKARKPPAKKRSTTAASRRRQTAPADDVRTNVQGALEALTQGVVVTRDRIQEVMDDAVSRGRMTPADANTVVADLIKRSRKQTDAIRSDIEQLIGRAGGELEKRATDARKRAMRSGGDRALREVDRARRAAGLGRFPILNYEDLTAGQISDRVGDLSPAELRKVRDHERRNANRKSVLSAIEKALG
jgi:polyhydroxyalkanoate synthesis regulator phasin